MADPPSAQAFSGYERPPARRPEPANLADILERVLDKGIVVAGDIRVNLLDIELLTIKLRLLVASVDTARKLGIDWWEHDPMLSSKARDLDEENRRLRERVAALESGYGAREAVDERRALDERRGSASREAGRNAPAAPERPSRGRPGRTAVADAGTYVYAISRGLDRDRLSGVTGVARAPVRAVPHADLAALVSTVSLAEFGEEALRRNLEELSWLEATARAHHRVVDAVAAVAPTAPLRLATVYRDDERVRGLLEERREDFVRVLDGIAGRTEWGAKAYADPEAFTRATAEASADSGDTRPGTAYLRRRSAQRQTQEEAWRDAAGHAEEIDATLRGLATASRLYPPQDPRLTGHTGWMVLNAAYLVEDGRVDEFAATVDRLAGRHPGIRVELTGPWVPYSFATIEEET